MVPDKTSMVAKAMLQADDTGVVRIGLAFKGKVTVFINEQEVFTGASDAVELLEYNYNRFRSQESINVNLKKRTETCRSPLPGRGG